MEFRAIGGTHRTNRSLGGFGMNVLVARGYASEANRGVDSARPVWCQRLSTGSAQGIEQVRLEHRVKGIEGTPGGKLGFHMFAGPAEFERDIIQERTPGLAAWGRR